MPRLEVLWCSPSPPTPTTPIPSAAWAASPPACCLATPATSILLLVLHLLLWRLLPLLLLPRHLLWGPRGPRVLLTWRSAEPCARRRPWGRSDTPLPAWPLVLLLLLVAWLMLHMLLLLIPHLLHGRGAT